MDKKNTPYNKGMSHEKSTGFNVGYNVGLNWTAAQR